MGLRVQTEGGELFVETVDIMGEPRLVSPGSTTSLLFYSVIHTADARGKTWYVNPEAYYNMNHMPRDDDAEDMEPEDVLRAERMRREFLQRPCVARWRARVRHLRQCGLAAV